MTNRNDPIYPYAWKMGKDAEGKDVSLVLNENPTQLTKREYFAAMAMQGLMANNFQGKTESFASKAVLLADALITALNETV